MREILFRGNRVDGSGWVEGSLVKENDVCSIIDYANHKTDTYSWVDVIPETVSQFTGLLDKNGKKIFEGDIIETDGSMQFSNYDSSKGSKRVVWFNPSGFVGARINNDFDKNNPSSAYSWPNYQLWNISKSLKIIGNIHDSADNLPPH